MKKKRKDECQFCTSRSCYEQIYRLEAPFYDEVHCRDHGNQAAIAADEYLGGKGSGIYRTHRSSTGKLKRGEY